MIFLHKVKYMNILRPTDSTLKYYCAPGYKYKSVDISAICNSLKLETFHMPVNSRTDQGIGAQFFNGMLPKKNN